MTTEKTKEEAETKKTPASSGSPPGATGEKKEEGIPLDQRGQFIQRMVAVGVRPPEAIPTIVDLFFGGDIDNLKWLNHVLQRQAAGFVNHHQRRLIMGWWAQTQGLPYDEDEFTWEDEKGAKGEKGAPKEPAKPITATIVEETGIGYKIVKDKDGEWVPMPGGPMAYQDAVTAAQKSNAIRALSQPVEGIEGGGEGGEGKPATKGGRGARSFQEIFMEKVLDDFIEGKKGRSSESDARVEALEKEINQIREDKMTERFERLEGLIANIASRDPWEEYDHVKRQAERLGWGPNVVTDQSPAVQIIKDTSDKLDRNVQRMVGIIERVALKGEEFKPEETRTLQQRDQKASELLNVAQARDRSRALRQQTFGA